MTRARSQQISLEETSYYHCVARCVRRAFLCGEDSHTGQSFEHRKQWIVDKVMELAGIFAIDVCAYAVMSNHYHVVLRVDSERVMAWSDAEVIRRWRHLFSGGVLVDRFVRGETTSQAERDKVAELAGQWRDRLSDISWFMRCLNEQVARQANKEDGCKGRFWEGRFKSQALLDERALLACMVYVDLNPVRAGIADTPEASDFTSFQARILAHAEQAQRSRASVDCARQGAEKYVGESVPLQADAQPNLSAMSEAPAALLPFSGGERADQSLAGIPFAFSDYLALTDWTGRAIREDKRGFIPESVPPILVRLGIDENAWIETVRDYGPRFRRAVGPAERLRRLARKLGHRWLWGLTPITALYPSPATSVRVNRMATTG
ncbi:MAG: transposase [Nitrococcus sp.]|nr:transposase [Nitrococcus sp.]